MPVFFDDGFGSSEIDQEAVSGDFSADAGSPVSDNRQKWQHTP
jgi:hypothetical protein